ncbi:MAG: hypothetical protein M1837_004306 [Sclerophora amabilis]|nr:MAG: hypothetical protein M1837_004306 [Sclerophora amabilis]
MAAAAVMMPGDTQPTTEMKSTLTPPPTEKMPPLDDPSSSELSELEDDDDIGDVEPDHYYEGGKIPVFKPTMDQFRSFKKFMSKIDKYGMKSGIVKVIPPKQWRDSLPSLDEAVKTIKVKNPITQEIAGNQGTYRQANIEKQRSYNLPQWRQLSEASDHQPPARRGERRRNQEKVPRSNPRSAPTPSSSAKKKGPGRPKSGLGAEDTVQSTEELKDNETNPKTEGPPTPTSPNSAKGEESRAQEVPPGQEIKEEVKDDDLDPAEEGTPAKGKGRQPKSVSSRRKYNRRAAAEFIDEAAFENFDYRITNQDAYTPERCEELERHYWKSLTYNSPLYGADMPGSLFNDTTTSWNVAKLENLLDVLGQKVPGVNTAYLYLGMWKSTFAWHLEDVDLYSINYIHFGAPKQWYSISQEDARRFEAAMKSVWPNDAKQCNQFLRHKTYLISPSLLQSQFNIRVNRLVHHEGEFVITFPYGYHSGYNLGYNCAESVNFATESWLDYGRVAKKCDCEADSVWIDVNEIERRLRGEETDYEETEGEDDNGDEDEDDDGAVGKVPSNLPTPPESVEGKSKQRVRKRKRDREDGTAKAKVKKIRVRIKAPAKEPCMLCPNDIPSERLLETDTGNEAHRLCALYTPETFIEGPPGSEKICNVSNIDKARLDLKCNFCRSKRGACFQCSQKKCTRAYHPTCAAAAGVLVDMRDVPVFGQDGTEYTDLGIDFRCRFHRPKRAKQLDGDLLEESALIKSSAGKLQVGDVVQMQYHKGEIFAGNLVENRQSEQMVLVDILPKGSRVEVEYKWILVLDPADSRLPVPSANAQPLAAHPAQKKNITKERQSSHPVADDPFCDPKGPHVWSEFHTAKPVKNVDQVNVDLYRPKALWYYLGKTSTEAKAQFTEDLQQRRHNPESNFLDTVRPPSLITASAPRKPSSTSRPAAPATGPNQHALNAVQANVRQSQQEQRGQFQFAKPEKPYQYKPRHTDSFRVDSQSLQSQQAFQQQAFQHQGFKQQAVGQCSTFPAVERPRDSASQSQPHFLQVSKGPGDIQFQTQSQTPVPPKASPQSETGRSELQTPNTPVPSPQLGIGRSETPTQTPFPPVSSPQARNRTSQTPTPIPAIPNGQSARVRSQAQTPVPAVMRRHSENDPSQTQSPIPPAPIQQLRTGTSPTQLKNVQTTNNLPFQMAFSGVDLPPQQPLSQQQAPIANMGSGYTTTSGQSFSPQQFESLLRSQIAATVPATPQENGTAIQRHVPTATTEITKQDPITSITPITTSEVLQQYPYLWQYHLEHLPSTYQSPYLPGSGFTESYLPLPPAPLPPPQSREDGPGLAPAPLPPSSLQDESVPLNTYEAFFAGIRNTNPATTNGEPMDFLSEFESLEH